MLESQCNTNLLDAEGDVFGNDPLGPRQDDKRREYFKESFKENPSNYFCISAEEAICLDLDIRNDGERTICCNRNDIVQNPNNATTPPSCRCVDSILCSLDQVDIYRTESCPISDSAQVCCPEDLITPLKACDLFTGYGCTQASKCSVNPTLPAPAGSTCFDRRNNPTDPPVCCHQSDLIEPSVPCESQPGYE